MAIVLWLSASCCCCLGGAAAPPAPPISPSNELSYALRDRVTHAKSELGPFSIEISDQELTSYIIQLLNSGEGEFPARDIQIEFNSGYIDIWATFIDIAPVDIPVYARVEIEAEHGQPIFHIVQANAGSFPLPGAMRETLSQSLGESIAELQLGLWIEDVEIEKGRMRLSGKITGLLPDLP